MSENKYFVEIDTVEGIKGGRVLLTFLFRPSRLMLAFILINSLVRTSLNYFSPIDVAKFTLNKEVFV